MSNVKVLVVPCVLFLCIEINHKKKKSIEIFNENKCITIILIYKFIKVYLSYNIKVYLNNILQCYKYKCDYLPVAHFLDNIDKGRIRIYEDT